MTLSGGPFEPTVLRRGPPLAAASAVPLLAGDGRPRPHPRKEESCLT